MKAPPGGFPYREPSIAWVAPRDGAMFDARVRQISAARANNPSATLDPSFDACAASLDLYTCARLKNDPKWCVAATDAVARTAVKARAPIPCAHCGSGARRRAQRESSKRAEELLLAIV